MSTTPNVCFDLDGVLVDTEPIWERVRRRFAEEHGGRWSSDLQERMMGVQTRDWSNALSEATGVHPDEVARSVIENLASEYREGLPVIEGAVFSVRRLAAQTALGLVSGSPLSLIRLVLELTALTDSFQVAMSSDDVERGKPAPDPYLGLARRLGVSPESCVAVEDSANGIRSAFSAGMAVIAIPRGVHRPAPDVLASAAAVLDDIAELTPAVLERVVAART
jgi:beta-phosphoglucomutase-like phosphatase (HAD superfamily)